MKKILIFSDSHGNFAFMNKIIEQNLDAHLILHAGDYANDIRRIETNKINYYCVRGNCDEYSGYDSLSPKEEIINLGRTVILLTHGHLFDVKFSSLEPLSEYAKQNGCNTVVFGHTHIPQKINVNNVFFLNPESINPQKSSHGASYGEIWLDDEGDIIKSFVKLA